MDISSGKRKVKQELTIEKIRQARNQITRPGELESMGIYILRAGGNTSKIMVVRIHFPRYGWFAAFSLGNKRGKIDTFSMADCGIIPYPEGGWNFYNYLVPIGKER